MVIHIFVRNNNADSSQSTWQVQFKEKFYVSTKKKSKVKLVLLCFAIFVAAIVITTLVLECICLNFLGINIDDEKT